MVTIAEALAESSDEASEDVEVGEAVTEAPEESGQAEAAAVSEPEGSNVELFNLDDYGDKVVEIVVDGETQHVPVAELRDGYMRQSAFTQKTQDLAAQRQELEAAASLASAYEQNPEATIRFLADQNGISLAEATAVAEQAEQDSWDSEQATADPRLTQIEQRLADLDRREARQEVEATISSLTQRFGEEFDPQSVVNRAIADGSDNLEATFMRMQGEKAWAGKQAQQDFDAKTAAGEASATAAKAAVAGAVTASGSSMSAGSSESSSITTVAQALEASMGDNSLWD